MNNKIKYGSEEDFYNMIKNKKILYIPIVSSINRETGEYNLDSDGNINRLVTAFSINDSFECLDLVLPKKHSKETKILDAFKENNENINFIFSDFFGIHAGEQRSNMFIITNLVNELERNKSFDSYDYVILDSQYLLIYLNKYNYVDRNKLIFWNYLCSTKKYQRSFTAPFVDITKDAINIAKYVIVTSPDILEFTADEKMDRADDSLFYIPKFVDRKLDIFSKYEEDQEVYDILDSYIESKTIPFYLPFRLTDEAYKMDLVISDFILPYQSIAEINGYDISLIYSDPNNSGEMENFIEKYPELDKDNIILQKVSPARDTFYTIIDHPIGVNIPYFEDIDFANHAAIWEFKDSNANIWVLPKYDGMLMPYYEKTDTSIFKSYEILKN
ncbi:MAG: hypothetical protein J1F35_05910 [Erysipelotrichales bacterium]|nr:hypothetical protein [Erysipelotrichales bacterium]